MPAIGLGEADSVERPVGMIPSRDICGFDVVIS